MRLNRRTFLTTSIIGATANGALRGRDVMSSASTALSPSVAEQSAAGWISLFNGRDLDGWYTYLRTSGRNDSKKYVRLEQGMIHIMGNDADDEPAEPGYLATEGEYGACRIRVEYKWGEKRFAPRLENKRDNGLLYYVVGEDRVWPTCVECQIQETDTGDIFLLGGTRGIHGSLTGGGRGGRAAGSGPGPGGSAIEPTGGRKLKEGDFENLNDWNVVEVVANGDQATHIVNGRIVNRLNSIQRPDPANAGQCLPLIRGKIALEIEYAEIWFRRVEILPL